MTIEIGQLVHVYFKHEQSSGGHHWASTDAVGRVTEKHENDVLDIQLLHSGHYMTGTLSHHADSKGLLRAVPILKTYAEAATTPHPVVWSKLGVRNDKGHDIRNTKALTLSKDGERALKFHQVFSDLTTSKDVAKFGLSKTSVLADIEKLDEFLASPNARIES